MWKDYAVQNAIEGLKKNVRAELPSQVPGIFKVVRKLQDEEEYRILVNVDSGEIILQGDTYHDKIECLISGFFTALDHFNYPYTCSCESEEVGV